MRALKGFTKTDLSIMAIMFLHAICAIMTGMILVHVLKEFDLTYAEGGSIESWRDLAVILVLVITVRMLKIFNAKTLFIISRLMIAVGFVVSALSESYSIFMAGVILAGLGAGFVESLIAQTITNLHAKDGNVEKFFNLLQSVFSIAVIVIPLAFGYFMDLGVTWRTLLLVTSILPLAVAAVLYFTNLPPVEPEEGGMIEALRNVFLSKTRTGWLFVLGIIVAGGLEAMFYTWIPTYTTLYLHDNQQYSMIGMSVFGAFMFLARFLNGILPGKKAVYGMMFMACAAGIISSVMLHFFGGLIIFYVAVAFAGLAVGPLWPSLTGLISDHVAAPKAGYFIVIAIMGIAGYMAMPFLAGKIGDLTGHLRNGFFLLPASIILLCFVVVRLRQHAINNQTYFK